MTDIHPVLAEVCERIRERSRERRRDYLAGIDAAGREGPVRAGLSCTNLAHAFAAAGDSDKAALRGLQRPNVAIVSAYNDMLSAHQPLGDFPPLIRQAARDAGATAQFAGGVPAMCDGITQGQPGMELSLFSRDTIAMATAIALSHNAFDAGLCLGVCDKIVPGLLIGALHFGHLPFVFVPAGPMPSGLPNAEKSRIRQLYAEGRVDRAALLEAESQSYHAPGTCTFYGTANSNQLLMEVMGLHLPGAAFVNPGTPLRDALTIAATRRVVELRHGGEEYTPVGRVVCEEAIVNAVVGLLATGGSTNHTIHLPAIARAAGIELTWDDFAELSRVVPLLARIYPSGKADVNHFHAAGGMAYLIDQLLDAGLLFPDVMTVAGSEGLSHYRREPYLAEGGVAWREPAAESLDSSVLRGCDAPFDREGGLRLLTGNLGRAVIKVSAVERERWCVEAPARVFESQEALLEAFSRDELNEDMVAVVRFQGPGANGMPELHKLTPQLGVLQDRGYRVALVTDGRMSGASGRVPAAIHLTPESTAGGALARVRDGDRIRLDAGAGTLEALVDADEWAARAPAVAPDAGGRGMGRELFQLFRANATPAEAGARVFGLDGTAQHGGG
ncbi:Phosphogluconate dehydratase [wastewater metagenome]|uniref:Phosphogluconate dehydratase n=2 Tax=unclassified sequences TaxID=12908 RepID=A0A5B8RIV2_9ZZZZ|nr:MULTISPECIES: phosphogluconate dehydratase [Arhodomonas]MCS4505847.1 phosphogluconate dehydratase [Arhodomonas aquaeolei]QEA06717.1 phosphogluconate dehydratase [uncultured organism]